MPLRGTHLRCALDPEATAALRPDGEGRPSGQAGKRTRQLVQEEQGGSLQKSGSRRQSSRSLDILTALVSTPSDVEASLHILASVARVGHHRPVFILVIVVTMLVVGAGCCIYEDHENRGRRQCRPACMA